MREVIDDYSEILDLFSPPKNLTFLIGAGCSLDSPTNIPNTRNIMDTIIEYICVPSEADKIKKRENLRFEALIEAFRDTLDQNLKIVDYFELFKSPNAQHYFLAEMIKKDNFVLTTNFDFLIEYALTKSGIPKEDIIIAITRSDFEKYANPTELVKQCKKPLYKIHGSTKNIITKEDTRDSLITTIQALGSNKKGIDIFSIEEFKRPLFENISDNRSLIIMGYSGSDDFDIIPTLKLLNGLQNIVWINHVNDDKGKIKIQEINSMFAQKSGEINKVNQILIEIQQINDTLRIFRVDVNTSNLINYLNQNFGFTRKDKAIPFQVTPLESWMKQRIPISQNEELFIKYLIPAKIYLDFDDYPDVKRCAEEIINTAKTIDNNYWNGVASYFLGRICRNMYKTRESEEHFSKAKDLLIKNRNDEKNILKSVVSQRYDRLSYLYTVQIEYANVRANQGEYREAIQIYLDTLNEKELREEFKEIPVFKKIRATCYGYLGNAYRNLGKFSRSIEYYELAIDIFEEIGNVRDQGTYKLNLGLAYRDIGQFERQKDLMEESLHIAKMVRDKRGESKALGGIASSLGYLGDYDCAVDYHKKSIEIIEQQNAVLIKSYLQEDFGRTELFSKKYESARNLFKKALIPAEEKRHKLLIQRRNSYIALTYLLESKLEQASKHIQTAFMYNDSKFPLFIGDFVFVVDGIIKVRKNKKSLANESFSTAFDLAKKKLLDEKKDYFAYSNIIISLIGMVLTTDKKDLNNLWVEKINQHNISIKRFESRGTFKEFELLCDALMPINPNFINSKKALLKPDF